ncbi:MAG: DNA-processing protein DprA [Prevotellaceae bacterium]|jgi:DNA processing protein|nr:DNA-processing protein DprA [Prevotellaceae bacterium]
MNNPALFYQIALTMIKGVGNVTAKNLITYIGNVEDIFRQTKAQLAKIPGVGDFMAGQIVSADIRLQAEKEMEFVLKNKISPLFYTDKNYPYRLKECADAPVLLYTKNRADLNANKFVGIVGTRNVTDYGKEICRELVANLAQRHPELVVVSGLAYGTDICAHKAALENNLATIGILGHGLDRIYPATHRPAAEKMLENGGLMTEYPSGTNPDKQNFVQRNRIIAGLVDAVVVVESQEKGGSLITAEFANNYNRDVFAFPGKITDERSRGCNALIKKNKANLIENADDLEWLMDWKQDGNAKTALQSPNLFSTLTDIEQNVFEAIRAAQPVQINQLSKILEIPISNLATLLIEMEFKNAVKCLPGNLYRCL